MITLSNSSTNQSIFRNEYNSINSQLNSIEREINEFLSILTRMDTYSIEIPSGLTNIRSQSYVYFGKLEEETNSLIDNWLKVRHSYLTIAKRLQDYLPQIQSLRNRLMRLSNAQGTQSDFVRLRNIRFEANSLDAVVKSLISEVRTSIKNVEDRFRQISSRIYMIETALKQLNYASFRLMDGENIVCAYEAKLLETKEKGTIYITDKRFIFESVKEIPLKKVLFITTKKKIVREVKYDIPIGYIYRVNKGKVGFFARGGIFIDFRQGAPVEKLVFDLKDYLIDYIIGDINYVLSGQADKEKLIGPKEVISQRIPRVIKCPVCGAPVKQEIVRGMTSIKCQYCGATIQLQ